MEARRLRVYCPAHKTIFVTLATGLLMCENGDHTLCDDFPFGNYWEYCCDCQTFYPSAVVAGNAFESHCPACARLIARRSLCNTCKIIGFESDDSPRRRAFELSAAGMSPQCPGCQTPPHGFLAHHECPRISASLVTALERCPFCDDRILPQTEDSTDAIHPSAHKSPDAADKPERRPAKAASASTSSRASVVCQSCGKRRKADEKSCAYCSAAAPPFSAGPASVQLRLPNRQRFILTASLAVLILSAMAYLWSTRSAGTEGAIAAKGNPKPENPAPAPVLPPGMVYVSGGELNMGNDQGDAYERPRHKVLVQPFFIDKYEVTCEEYEKFIKATGYQAPSNWKAGNPPPNAARHPVRGVTWDDARRFAQWSGKRLPTESEWEYAARGAEGRRYPWGNEWQEKAANVAQSSSGKVAEVGSFPLGTSPCGAFDMVGNVWEWTADSLKAYPGGSLPEKLNEDYKVIRGGSCIEDKNQGASATYRGYLLARGSQDYSFTGFRCAKDIKP
jgi:formylglycine-generating enzyme required for sulfatase activity